MLNKQEIFTDGRIKIDTSEHFSTLSIGAIEPGDSGKIDVIVENDIGIDTAVASLTVQGKMPLDVSKVKGQCPGGGGGGTLNFSSYIGSGPAFTLHPQKISGISSTPKKCLKF